MVKTHQKCVALIISLLLVLSMCFVGNVFITASAAAGDVIYFTKPATWTNAYCYVWGGTAGANAAWPGEKMTEYGNGVYSYTVPKDQVNVIFSNGSGSQTADLTLPGNNKLFTLSGSTSGSGLKGTWTDFNVPSVPTVSATPGTSNFYTTLSVALSAKNVTSATYSVNKGTATAYTDGTTIKIGETAAIGDKITLDLSGTDGTKTVTNSYTYTKTEEPAFSGAYAYLSNTAGWTSCYVYYWNGSTKNAAWPGVKLTDADKDAAGNYQVAIDSKYIGTSDSGVIFSNAGSSQSADLKIALNDSKIYDNSAKTWEIYDTSALKFISFGTDVASPQYKDTDITISAAAANGSGTSGIYYRFTATDSAKNVTVLQDYAANSSIVWAPATAGTYTLTCEIKDSNGNTNSRDISYVIEDDTLSVKPVLKGITPNTGSQILINKTATVDVKASGGKVGTNLLFYKIAVTDPTGKAVNTVYYKTSNKLDFTPTQTGTYTIDVSVQNSSNTTVKKTYQYTSVTSIDPTNPVIGTFSTSSVTPQPVNTAITLTATALQGTAPYTYQFSINGAIVKAFSSANTYVWTPSTAGTYTLEVTVKDSNSKTATKQITNYVITKAEEYQLGDVNLDGKVNLRDVADIQKFMTDSIAFSDVQKKLADVNKDGVINLKDTSALQNIIAE